MRTRVQHMKQLICEKRQAEDNAKHNGGFTHQALQGFIQIRIREEEGHQHQVAPSLLWRSIGCFWLYFPCQSADNRRSWRLKCHPAVPHMDNRRYLPQAGVDKSKLSTSAIQPEHNSAVRPVRREPGDSVITTRVRMEEHSDVPCKVPRFQYVDFPSLHQCIKQLSVPPLEGWLASCPLGKVPAHRPSSPKEKVPKFKYVDYPSLYHCIQQLSVPPLEIWSSKLTKPSPGGLQTDTVGVQCPSQVLGGRRKNEEMQENRAEPQSKEKRRSGSTVHVPIPEPAVLQHMKNTKPGSASEKEENSQGDSNMHQKHSGFSSDCVSRSEAGSRPELDRAVKGNEKSLRPSVISLVRTERQKHRVELEERPEGWKSPAPITQVEQPIDLELVCPLGRQIFTDPVEHQTHQCRHKDKGPH
ncbi:hypothetical protein PGIGA_G00171000 [Pangasianodon gigas]|uniref:Uncharacterized protein n=1 Tax=Pangasianodon gigas TaxID=30993 RepID=A0ACC5XTN2_PANGG|nr:hypothetical protein [Pangasianodon gigas]